MAFSSFGRQLHGDCSKNMVIAVGLMSGTSMDGVDVALLETDGIAVGRFGPAMTRSYSADERNVLRAALEEARQLRSRDARPGILGKAERMITRVHAEAVRDFLAGNVIEPQSVGVIGFHGHTVLHNPKAGLTVQLGSGEDLANELGIPVVYDLRAADIAAGGQGAPLVPIYHKALVLASRLDLPAAVINIGGVANITWIEEEGRLIAFDTGPGNALLDEWALRHTGEPMDRDGRLASAGQVVSGSLVALLDEPYFTTPPPKSLDRNAFSLVPVEGLSPEDGAATLVAFTAEAIALALLHLPSAPKCWVLTGGGARNPALRSLLSHRLPGRLMTGEELEWQGDFIEAQAFAFLAVRSLKGLPITFPGTTGVPRPLTGGCRALPRRAA